MLKEFKKDPHNYMRNFLISHPEFLDNALKSDDAKTVKFRGFCVLQIKTNNIVLQKISM